jgi:hypothetical protein
VQRAPPGTPFSLMPPCRARAPPPTGACAKSARNSSTSGGCAGALASKDSLGPGCEPEAAADAQHAHSDCSWIGERVPTIDEIKALSPEESRHLWRTFLHHVSKELLALKREEAAGGPAAEAATAANNGGAEFGTTAEVVAALRESEPDAAQAMMPQEADAPALLGVHGALPPGAPPGGALHKLHMLIGHYMR